MVVVAIIGILVMFTLPAIQRTRETARSTACLNNLHQLGIAVRHYHEENGAYPPGRFRGTKGLHRWSQHARLLPYLEQERVHLNIDYHKSPGNGTNARVRTAQIATFRCPSDSNRMITSYNKNHFGWGKNNYKGNAGNDIGLMVNGREQNNGIFLTDVVVRDAHVTDGESNTALFAEAVLGDANDQSVEIPSDWFRISESHTTREAVYQACQNVVPQTGPANQICRSGRNWVWGNYIPTRYNHVMLPNGASCARRNSTNGDLDAGVNDKGGATTASSRHIGGINIVMADSSARFILSSIDIQVWWALGSRNGGEAISETF